MGDRTVGISLQLIVDKRALTPGICERWVECEGTIDVRAAASAPIHERIIDGTILLIFIDFSLAQKKVCLQVSSLSTQIKLE